MLEKRVKSGLAVTPRHLKLCDDNLRRAGVGSRNDFVEQAIEFYCSHLLSHELAQLRSRGEVPMERFETLSKSLGTGAVQAVGGSRHHGAHPGADGEPAGERGAVHSIRQYTGSQTPGPRPHVSCKSYRREQGGSFCQDDVADEDDLL